MPLVETDRTYRRAALRVAVHHRGRHRRGRSVDEARVDRGCRRRGGETGGAGGDRRRGLGPGRRHGRSDHDQCRGKNGQQLAAHPCRTSAAERTASSSRRIPCRTSAAERMASSSRRIPLQYRWRRGSRGARSNEGAYGGMFDRGATPSIRDAASLERSGDSVTGSYGDELAVLGQKRNSRLNLTTKPRLRRSQPRSGRNPPVTSRSSV